VHAHGFWEVSLFSITSDNERAQSCDRLLTTLGSDEGTFCTSFMFIIPCLFMYLSRKEKKFKNKEREVLITLVLYLSFIYLITLVT